MRKKKPTDVTAIRKIKFSGDGSSVLYASDLPFNAPGLRWQGAPAVTSSQLQAESRAKRQSKRPKNEGSDNN